MMNNNNPLCFVNVQPDIERPDSVVAMVTSSLKAIHPELHI